MKKLEKKTKEHAVPSFQQYTECRSIFGTIKFVIFIYSKNRYVNLQKKFYLYRKLKVKMILKIPNH